MRLLVRMKLAHKLFLCSAAFSLPIIVLLYYAVSGFERQIRFTEREIAGTEMLKPLCQAAILLNQPRTEGVAGTLDALIAEIRKREEQPGQLLPPSGRAGNRPQEFISSIYGAFRTVGERYNLILDPDLDSYYLADLALLHIPSLHQTLGRDSAAVLEQSALGAMRRAVSVAVAENRRRNPRGSPVEAVIPAALARFENSAGAARYESLSALWQASTGELHSVLETRVAGLRSKELNALVLTLAALGIAVTMLVLIVRNVNVPLTKATRIAEKIAAGRLGAAEASLLRAGMAHEPAGYGSSNGSRVRDEAFRLLDSFATMARSLGSLLNEVRDSCSQVDGSSSDIAAALRQLEATVVEQAACTNQVVATSNEIFATVQQLAENMRAVTGMAAEAAELAGTGLAGLNEINAAMKDTLEGTDSVSSALSTISRNAADIHTVLGVITKIANRTNLISLNAAIEAEKAGASAAGFTAVGLEIRRVADQTAVAALDIEKMLEAMQTAVGEGVRAMAEYSGRARCNSERVVSSTADLGRSIECTRKLEPHFEAVNTGMQMQAQGARQILESMQQLAAAAGQTRDSLAQFRDVAGHMRGAVSLLQAGVARFSVT